MNEKAEGKDAQEGAGWLATLLSATLEARVAEPITQQELRSEPRAPRWAVISERGVEAAELTLDEAADLRRRLSQERIFGLAIVTNEAARRLLSSETAMPDSTPRRLASR